MMTTRQSITLLATALLLMAGCKRNNHEMSMEMEYSAAPCEEYSAAEPTAPDTEPTETMPQVVEQTTPPEPTHAQARTLTPWERAYQDGFDDGDEMGMHDGRAGCDYGENYDDTSHHYRGELARAYAKGYAEGYEAGYDEGDVMAEMGDGDDY